MKARVAQQELIKERGVSPLAGCLPLLLQMPLLFIMYSVIQNGLTNQDPTAMLEVFGVQVVPLTCTNVVNGVVDPYKPCIDTIIPFFGRHRRQPAVDALQRRARRVRPRHQHPGHRVGPAPARPVADDAADDQPEDDDPNTQIQRQTMLFLPLISVAYGGFLPAGLFIYWITATIFSIVQQYLIVGWGGMFPLFGWTPRFAADHTPRFPVSMPPPPEPSKRAAILTDADKKTTADKTIRPRERGRQGRRGRRR